MLGFELAIKSKFMAICTMTLSLALAGGFVNSTGKVVKNMTGNRVCEREAR